MLGLRGRDGRDLIAEQVRARESCWEGLGGGGWGRKRLGEKEAGGGGGWKRRSLGEEEAGERKRLGKKDAGGGGGWGRKRLGEEEAGAKRREEHPEMTAPPSRA